MIEFSNVNPIGYRCCNKIEVGNEFERVNMLWENLPVYKSIKKEDIKPAFRKLAMIIGNNLREYGFKKKGRKIFRLSNDILEIIDIDYRGSWSGQDKYFNTNIGLVPLCWPRLSNEYYLVACKEISEIDKKIKHHYRLAEEYELLADYLTRRIIGSVFPYFDKYNSTAKIVKHTRDFSSAAITGGYDPYNNHLLILSSELKQHQNINAMTIIDAQLKKLNQARPSATNRNNEAIWKSEKLEWEQLKTLLEAKNWNKLDELLTLNEKSEMKSLKIKPFLNKG